MANPLLKLPEDVTTTLFRLIETQLRSNPTLSATVRNWQTWEGVPGDKQPPALTSAPWVCLTPHPESEDWFSPETQVGRLTIRIDALVRGTCIDDVMNLWGAIRAALSPRNAGSDGVCFNVKLQQSRAHKGLVLMSAPLVDTSQDAGQDGAFKASGSIMIEYRALARS